LAYLGLVVYGSLTPSPPELTAFPGSDKLMHLTVYATMMLWFGFLYRSRRSLLILCLSFITLGVLLDVLQGRTGHRSMELLDMVANAFGVLMGWLLVRSRIGLALSKLEDVIFGDGF
jgi:VanZ family protein